MRKNRTNPFPRWGQDRYSGSLQNVDDWKESVPWMLCVICIEAMCRERGCVDYENILYTSFPFVLDLWLRSMYSICEREQLAEGSFPYLHMHTLENTCLNAVDDCLHSIYSFHSLVLATSLDTTRQHTDQHHKSNHKTRKRERGRHCLCILLRFFFFKLVLESYMPLVQYYNHVWVKYNWHWRHFWFKKKFRMCSHCALLVCLLLLLLFSHPITQD